MACLDIDNFVFCDASNEINGHLRRFLHGVEVGEQNNVVSISDEYSETKYEISPGCDPATATTSLQ